MDMKLISLVQFGDLFLNNLCKQLGLYYGCGHYYIYITSNNKFPFSLDRLIYPNEYTGYLWRAEIA